MIKINSVPLVLIRWWYGRGADASGDAVADVTAISSASIWYTGCLQGLCIRQILGWWVSPLIRCNHVVNYLWTGWTWVITQRILFFPASLGIISSTHVGAAGAANSPLSLFPFPLFSPLFYCSRQQTPKKSLARFEFRVAEVETYLTSRFLRYS